MQFGFQLYPINGPRNIAENYVSRMDKFGRWPWSAQNCGQQVTAVRGKFNNTRVGTDTTQQ